MAVILVVTAGAVVGHLSPDSVRQYFAKSETVAEDSSTESTNQKELEAGNPSDGQQVDRQTFLSDAVLVIEMEGAFSPRGSAALRHVEQQLEAKDFIRSVQWMDEIPTMNIFGLPEPLLPHKEASQQKFDAARAKALKNPFIKGVMMSEDMKTLVFMVNYDRLFMESDEQAISGLRMAAEEAAAAYPDVKMDFSVTGGTPMWLTAIKSHDANQFWFQAIGYGMIAVMSLILFRGFMSVLIVALAPIMGVFWTLGYCNYLGYENNPFMEVILPVLVSLVGLTDGVHLMVTTRKLRASGLSTLESSRTALSQVGLACALTSLTTAIGFGSLVLADHEYIQQFGVCCVIGVLLCFVAVVTVIPLACSSWMGKNIHLGIEKSLIDQNLGRISNIVLWVLPRKKWISFAAIVATVLLVGISLTLRPDERISNSMPASSEAAIAFAKLDKALGGLEQSKVMISWDHDKPDDEQIPRSGDEMTAERVAVIKEANDLLRNEPLIGYPLSIVEMIDSMPGQGDTVARS
jgi:predicted RND superfamily exporter protein